MGYSKQFIEMERDNISFEKTIYKKLRYEIIKKIKKINDGIQDEFSKEKTGS
jgi:hypothetical protein